jgi:hypothetical protein
MGAQSANISGFPAVRRMTGPGSPKPPSGRLIVIGSVGEGFRMPAGRDLSSRTEGRLPKASQEGTRGG